MKFILTLFSTVLLLAACTHTQEPTICSEMQFLRPAPVLVELQGVVSTADNGEFVCVTHRGVIRASCCPLATSGEQVLLKTFNNGYEKEGWLIVHPCEKHASRSANGTLQLDATDFNFTKTGLIRNYPGTLPDDWEAMRRIIKSR